MWRLVESAQATRLAGELVVLEGAIDPNPANRGFDWNKPNLGFDSYYVNFELPPIAGTRSLEGPVFAEKR